MAISVREGRPARATKWKPRRWQPEYERMVAYSCMGMSNKAIAEKMGYTKEHVSNILNLDEAEVLRAAILKKMRANATANIPEVLGEIAEKTVLRLKQVVDNDDLFEKMPFAVIDRGLEVMKGLGHLKGGGNGSNGGNINIEKAVFLPAQAANNLNEGLSKANEVLRIHSGKTE